MLARVSLSLGQAEQYSRPFLFASYLLLFGIFSIALLGNAAHNLLLGLPILLLVLCRETKQFPEILRTNISASLTLLLFLWLSLSLLWLEDETGEGIAVLKKYRELLFIPLLMVYFQNPRLRQFAWIALYCSLLLSLIASYLIHFDLADLTENASSLKNRIFHGISMALFAYLSLHYANQFHKFRALFILLFILCLHNLFFIENGRTGYLAALALAGLYIYQAWSWKGVLIGIAFATSGGFALALCVDLSGLRIVGNISLIFDDGAITQEVLQRVDIRIEYYILSFKAFVDNWLTGVGVGGFPLAYEQQMALQPTFWKHTANAHNEFLMVGVQSGIIGLFLFSLFIITGFFNKLSQSRTDTQIRQAVFLLIAIACMFNSSFLDHGDGTLFMVLTALALTGTTKASDKQPEA